MSGSSEASLSKLGSPVTEKSVDHALLSVEPGEAPYMGRGKHMRRAWLKMDLLALPIIVISYVLNVLDKANIGNARVAGLQDQLQIDDIQFSLALTTTLIASLWIPITMNHLIMLIGPRIVLPCMLALGGVACAMQGVVTNFAGFVTCRIFLGIFEGGILSAVNLYLASFYPRRKLQFRISILWSVTALALALSGLLAAAILNMDGVAHRPGWAWLFILEGVVTTAFGMVSFVLLPNSPTTAWFLTKDEKAYVSDILHSEGILATADEQPTNFWHEARRIIVQPHAIMLAIAAMFVDFTGTSLGYFLPSIIVGLGFEGIDGQLKSVAPFAVAIVVAISTAIIADRYAARGATMIALAAMSSTGFAIFLGSNSNKVRYGSLFLSVPGAIGGVVPLSTWVANNSAPLTRCSVAIGLIVTATNFSSTLSVWMFGPISKPPLYREAEITLMAFQIGTLLCAVGTWVWLFLENRRKKRAREALAREGREREEREREEERGPLTNESIWFTYVM